MSRSPNDPFLRVEAAQGPGGLVLLHCVSAYPAEIGDANVLVTGEHGTGKEVVAQTLHALSPRASMPLVAVNTGALPEGTANESNEGDCACAEPRPTVAHRNTGAR